MNEKETNKLHQIIWLQSDVINWQQAILKLDYKIESNDLDEMVDDLMNIYYEELEKRGIKDDNED